MAALVFTVLAEAKAFSAAVDAALGYPKAPTQVGFGRRAPLPRGITVRYGDIRQHPTLSQWTYPWDATVQGLGLTLPPSASVQTLDSSWNLAPPIVGPDMSTCTPVVSGCNAFIYGATEPRIGSPWVWYSPTIAGTLPDANDTWTLDKLRNGGLAVAGIDVGESYGNAAGRAKFTDFYNAMVGFGFSSRVCMLVRSRGGLQGYNWAAEHASAVAGIAGIYPVGDILSYPGSAVAAAAYGMSEAAFLAQLSNCNPIERLSPLRNANISIYHLHGDSDGTVPLNANSQVVKDRYDQLGGSMTLVVVPGAGHDLNAAFFQSQPLVDFILGHAA